MTIKVYEVSGNYVEGLEEDAGKILEYFGKDFLGLKKQNLLLSLQRLGKVQGK